MPIWRDRYLLFLGALGIVLSIGIGYQYAMKIQVFKLSCHVPASSLVPNLRHAQLPSVIPNLHLAAKRHLVTVVDLRRADLMLGSQGEPDLNLDPLLDKVVFAPKKFIRHPKRMH